MLFFLCFRHLGIVYVYVYVYVGGIEDIVYFLKMYLSWGLYHHMYHFGSGY